VIATYTLKQHDTAPLIQDVLSDGSDAAVNLTGATIEFHMTSWDRQTVVVAAGAVTNWGGGAPDTSGQVQYAPSAGDVANAGVFRGEWEVTFAGNKVETWPNEGSAVVNIEADLA
jgi:hypothetical protein